MELSVQANGIEPKGRMVAVLSAQSVEYQPIFPVIEDELRLVELRVEYGACARTVHALSAVQDREISGLDLVAFAAAGPVSIGARLDLFEIACGFASSCVGLGDCGGLQRMKFSSGGE
jgi:hypothetical protein